MSNAAPATDGPDRSAYPLHVAIIMDGNGRWAAARGLPRAEGHRRGVDALRRVVRAAHELGIVYLTIFFFFFNGGLILYAVRKWKRRSDKDVTPHITHDTRLELVWSIIPLMVVMLILRSSSRIADWVSLTA